MKKIYVGKSLIEGKGIHAGEPIHAGERIQYITGRRVKKLPRTKEEALSIPNWFGLSKQYWIDPQETPFRYLNHSCNPNAAVAGTKILTALRDIKQDEEITIDYSITDADTLWEMPCFCKEAICRKVIRSIQTVPTDVFKRHMPYIPRYFQRLYIRNYVRSKLNPNESGAGNGKA